MKKNGGYLMVDLSGATVGSSVTISGICDKIKSAIANGKAVFVEGIVSGSQTLSPCFVDVAQARSGSLLFTIPMNGGARIDGSIGTNDSVRLTLVNYETPNMAVTVPFNTTAGQTATLSSADHATLREALYGKRAIYGTFTYGAGDDDYIEAMVVPQGIVEEGLTPTADKAVCRIILADATGIVYVLGVNGTTVTTLKKLGA